MLRSPAPDVTTFPKPTKAPPKERLPLLRVPLRRRSKKRDRYQRELDRVSPALYERAGDRCELSEYGQCAGMLHRHHRLRRSHAGGNQLSNLLLVCDRHHSVIHLNPSASYDRGWMIRGVS